MSMWRKEEDIKEQLRKSDLRTKELQEEIFFYMSLESAKGSVGADPKANQSNTTKRLTKWLIKQ